MEIYVIVQVENDQASEGIVTTSSGKISLTDNVKDMDRFSSRRIAEIRLEEIKKEHTKFWKKNIDARVIVSSLKIEQISPKLIESYEKFTGLKF